MGKPEPQKRKPIRKDGSADEIIDNVKNNKIQMVTRSATRRSTSEQISRENNSSEITSDEEEDSNQRTKSSKQKKDLNRTYDIDEENINQRSYTSTSGHESLEDTELSSQLSEGDSPSQTRRKSRNQLDNSFKKQKVTSTKNESNVWRYAVILAVVAVAIGVIYLYYTDDDPTPGEQLNKGDRIKAIMEDVTATFKSMRKKYKNQGQDLWTDAFVSIRNIIHDPKKPSIIVLLGSRSDPMDCLAVLLGNVSSNALNSGILQLTPDKFENDIGSVITFVRSSVKDKKAVIVWDLLNINVEALKAFHNLCDRINPLVGEVIYIITVIADNYDKATNPLEFVEKELHKKLSGKIKEDAIQPLITRITDGPILAVNPEPNLKDCPLPRVSRKVW